MTQEKPQDQSCCEGQSGEQEKESSTSADQKEKKTGKQGQRESGFRGFVDGSARIAVGVGETLGEALKGITACCSGRNNVVMVRVDDESLKRVDQLVDSGIFRSRSESAAWLIARGIAAEAVVFSKLESKVEEINRLKEELRSMLGLEDQKQGA
jgi:hypothetical protein